MAVIAVSVLPCCTSAHHLPLSPSSSCSSSYVPTRSCRVAGGGPAVSAMAGCGLVVRLGALRKRKVLDLGVLSRRSYYSGSRSGSALARAVWKQEVLWAEAPVADIGRASEQHFQLVLDVSGNRELMDGHTRPGQFVQVKVGDNKPVFLAIASPPNVAAKGSLEFLVKSVEGSASGLLCSLGKGDRVELSQVMGNGFNVEQVAPAEDFPTVLLFATGSGISPIRSLMEAGFDAHKRQDVRLYYGARNLGRMAYQDKFKEWEASGVVVVPVLSQPDDDWTGEQGYVQAAFAKTKGIIKAAQAGAFLCGHKEMAQDVTALLLADGVPKNRILLNF